MQFDKSTAKSLEFWLAHDVWTPHQAFSIFCLANPNYSKNGHLPMLCDPWDFDEDEANRQYEVFWAIWRSGIYAGLHENEFNPPSYYIEWACTKKLEVPWLDWANSNALLRNEPSKPKAASTTDNTLLATIAALLASWPNGKPPSGKDLEKAASSVGVTISDDSIRKALKAARDLAPTLPA